VENNDYAKNVLLIAELRNNDKANDILVRVMNRENNSLASFFYKSGLNFHDRMVISVDKEIIQGYFGFYDGSAGRYSITFADSTGGAKLYEILRSVKMLFYYSMKNARNGQRRKIFVYRQYIQPLQYG
jgi:hypothetical protein